MGAGRPRYTYLYGIDLAHGWPAYDRLKVYRNATFHFYPTVAEPVDFIKSGKMRDPILWAEEMHKELGRLFSCYRIARTVAEMVQIKAPNEYWLRPLNRHKIDISKLKRCSDGPGHLTGLGVVAPTLESTRPLPYQEKSRARPQTSG